MGAVLAFQTQLETEECYQCGTLFAMSPQLRRAAREHGATFYCPSGHGQVYSKTEVQRLTEERNQAMAAQVRAENDANLQRTLREQAEREREKADRKLKRRLGAGVCPCCQRTFSQLAQHMAKKHPEIAPVAAVKAQAKRKGNA